MCVASPPRRPRHHRHRLTILQAAAAAKPALPAAPAAPADEPIPAVTDEQAFASTHLADYGLEAEAEAVYHWDVASWDELPPRLTGPEFECGGHRWRILLFPFGNSHGQPNDMVSLYLDYADAKGKPEGWHVCAQFSLVISNPTDPTIFVSSLAHHRFTHEEMDWGFTRFSELKKLTNPADGRARPILEGGRARISAFVRVVKDPTGVLWHNFANYDSKKETGFVGIKNQGATCYMNSLLQSLFLTTAFRKAVYQIPTENDTPSESVPLSLQRLFYQLQTSDQPVGTTELTKSFGWRSLDSFLQHDVQEFNRVLQDKLEHQMKGTKADGAIQRLFTGKMRSYITCLDVDYVSSRTEQFYDIQLNVKGMPTLERSFRNYIAVERLEGENKYQADGHGLQDALKGVTFESFPPVLHLQLKRFEYNVEKDSMVKINDRHEFPLEIDLAPYIDQDAPEKKGNWKYHLHGVLVHSGDLNGGHYFALIKPARAGGWFKFDDDRVTPVTVKEVLEDNYGGEPLAPNGVRPAQERFKRSINAYMLVYIRETKYDEVLPALETEDTPAHLRKRLEEERRLLETKRKEREEQHLYMTVKLVTESTFRKHQGFDLATFDDRTLTPSDLPTFRVKKDEPFLSFKTRMAEHFKHPESDIRFWVLVNRQNKTVRPDNVIPESDPALTMEMVREKMASRQTDLRLFLELDAEKLAEFDARGGTYGGTSMVFLKYFDVFGQTLQGLGRVYVQNEQNVGDLTTTINQRMRWPPTTTVKLYEEIKPGMIEQMKPSLTFRASEIQDGDIVCFQMDLPERDVHDLEAQSMYSNPVQFYDFLQNQIKVLFKPRFPTASYKQEVYLTLSKKMTYDLMSAKAGELLKHDPLKIRFVIANGPNGTPKTVIKRSANQTVGEIVSVSYLQGSASLLYYELLDVSIVELETKRSIRVYWTGAHNKEEDEHRFLLPRTKMVHDLADELSKKVQLTPGGTGRVRVFEVASNGKSQKELSSADMVGNLSEAAELFAEEVPTEEVNVNDDDKVVNVFHFSRDVHRVHGIPFRFVVRRGEKFSDTKKRIQTRLDVPDKEFGRFRFALVQSSLYQQPSYIEDGDVLWDHRFQPDDVIGLDHPDRTGRSTASHEKGIKIRS